MVAIFGVHILAVFLQGNHPNFSGRCTVCHHSSTERSAMHVD